MVDEISRFVSWLAMYRLINQQIETLLQQINRQNDLQRYIWLMQTLPDVDVTSDSEFQRVYRRYWQLNPARLSPQCRSLFSIYYQISEMQTEIGIEAVARHLLKFPTRRDGGHTLQFSFATKLVHVLRPDRPVYDSTVAASSTCL